MDENVINHTSLRLPWMLLVDDHLWRALATWVGVRDSELDPKGDGNRVGSPGRQLEDIGRHPTS
jgi:hypothetical protein